MVGLRFLEKIAKINGKILPRFIEPERMKKSKREPDPSRRGLTKKQWLI